MKLTRTILTAAVLIAGLIYVVEAGHPPHDAVTDSCSTQPKQIHSYFVGCTNCLSDPVVIIPEAEGHNGFMITDLVVAVGGSTSKRIRIFEDGVEITSFLVSVLYSVNFTSGIPVNAGSEITFDVPNLTDTWITLSGYAY